MRKAILTVLMALVLVIPAYAAEGDAATDQPIQQEQEPVVVASLEELQAAIDAAEDGDTIYISSTISVMRNLRTDKLITIKRQEGFNSGSIFQLFDNGVIDGFCFADIPESDRAIYICTTRKGMAFVQNCTFTGDDNNFKSFIYNDSSNITVSNCSFVGNGWIAVECTNCSTSIFENCIFRENKSGAISNINGTVELNNCIITDNFSHSDGAINSCGKATLINCQIRNNLRYGERIGLDIFSYFDGELTIINENEKDGCFYQCLTGVKVELPIIDFSTEAMLVYLTEEQAADYFVPAPPNDESQQPGDQTEDNNTTGGEQPPQEPTQPSEGEGTGKPNTPDNGNQDISQEPVQPPQAPSEKPVEPPEGNRPVEQPEDNNPPADDKPTDNQPEVPEQPKEPPVVPPQDNETDNKPEDIPQPPQKPSDGNSGNDDDSNPPADYRPSQRPTRPTVIIRERTESKVQTQPDTPPTAQPPLVCNGTVIDTTRTVVLLGYKDGLLHEDDLLTRAQLAAIVYRLLDDASIVLYSNAELTFDDIPADAWCAQYVKVMQAAGIVNGIGGGKYNPNGTVTWAHVLTILSRFVKPQEYTLQLINYNGWAVESVQTAVALGWIEDSVTFAPDAAITRGELAQLINGVLALYR